MQQYFILFCTILLFHLISIVGVKGEIKYPENRRLPAWLNYEYVENDMLRDHYLSYFKHIKIKGTSPSMTLLKDELSNAFTKLFRRDISFNSSPLKQNFINIFLVEENDPLFDELNKLNNDGYMIKTDDTNRSLKICSLTEAGLLYGTFKLLSMLQKRESLSTFIFIDSPLLDLRMINHWDNLDGTIERGYSGQSIFKWDELPDGNLNRYHDYAKANASIGINAISINNVNADPNILKPVYLEKVKRLAEIFRPYNIKLFLSVNFASPISPSSTPNVFKKWGGIGNLDKSDPLNKDVIDWWSNKIDEIYKEIPDFGGFVIKANSEGMPGPQDYGRTHADGANMFARLLKPYGGIVVWRAFVYNHQRNEDRVKQAYLEFINLDGEFDDNVLLQVKNGPLDFQPSEPPSPLFGAMKKTNLIPELQITQEYVGHSTYLVYLAPMWEKFFKFDTYQPETQNSTVAGIIQDNRQKLTGIAGVSNVGDDPNWTGHHFAQANWYLFGRLAWNPQSDIEKITADWIRLAWSNDDKVVKTIKGIMERSLNNFIDLQTPFGLPVTVDGPTHYHPAFSHRNGTYWKADSNGIGYDRSSSGTDFVSQYHKQNRDLFNNIETCPKEYLLFFHFIEWDKRINNKENFYELITKVNYESITKMRADAQLWDGLKDNIDLKRHQEVRSKFNKQLYDAEQYHNNFLLFLQSIRD